MSLAPGGTALLTKSAAQSCALKFPESSVQACNAAETWPRRGLPRAIPSRTPVKPRMGSRLFVSTRGLHHSATAPAPRIAAPTKRDLPVDGGSASSACPLQHPVGPQRVGAPPGPSAAAWAPSSTLRRSRPAASPASSSSTSVLAVPMRRLAAAIVLLPDLPDLFLFFFIFIAAFPAVFESVDLRRRDR